MTEQTIKEQMIEPAKALLVALDNDTRVDKHIDELTRLLDLAKQTGLE